MPAHFLYRWDNDGPLPVMSINNSSYYHLPNQYTIFPHASLLLVRLEKLPSCFLVLKMLALLRRRLKNSLPLIVVIIWWYTQRSNFLCYIPETNIELYTNFTSQLKQPEKQRSYDLSSLSSLCYFPTTAITGHHVHPSIGIRLNMEEYHSAWQSVTVCLVCAKNCGGF